MKLSYVIPVYNVEQYLRECLDSILAQTIDECEVILVDDGSPDGCPQICDEYAANHPDKIKVIHKENSGAADSRNVGLLQAQGEYVCFFDSDDYFKEDGIGRIVDIAVRNDADILQNSYFSVVDGVDGTDRIVKSPFNVGRVYLHNEMEVELCRSSKNFSVAFAWRNIYKREFLIKNKILFPAELRMVEDPPFNILAFSKAERFVAVDDPIYCYRLRENSLQRKKYVEDYDKVIEYQWSLKLKYYEENCTPMQEFYEDIGEYTVKAILPLLIGNVYRNKIADRYEILKRIGDSDMLRRSFADYDINKFKSKSLDWWMTFFVEKRMYRLAHLLCEKVLYK